MHHQLIDRWRRHFVVNLSPTPLPFRCTGGTVLAQTQRWLFLSSGNSVRGNQKRFQLDEFVDRFLKGTAHPSRWPQCHRPRLAFSGAFLPFRLRTSRFRSVAYCVRFTAGCALAWPTLSVDAHCFKKCAALIRWFKLLLFASKSWLKKPKNVSW